MVCSSHLKVKYVRFLIKYHLCIFFCTFLMASICSSFLIYKHRQIDTEHLLQGFLVHGTKKSDDYRKLIALIRQTQITHLYPHSTNSKIYQQTPYPSFNPHINPCTKRFYLSTCPILSYTELTLEFSSNQTNLFNNLNTFKSLCKLEIDLKLSYTNCSTNQSCCQFIGPIGLVSNYRLNSFEQCENLTENDLKHYHEQWLSCQSSSSSCFNSQFQTYFQSIHSNFEIKIYLSIETNIYEFYERILSKDFAENLHLKSLDFDVNNEEILLKKFLRKNSFLIYSTLIIYLFCLLFFVKNFFFIFIQFLHFIFTLSLTCLIYICFFHFPLTILNLTSFIFAFYLILIDAFLWYSCWFNSHHRRDDCTIQRIIENLITQTFFYLIPKNLTAIIILVITYTNQIIAIQCFSLTIVLFISISFIISFFLYPVSFIFILRYRSLIPTIEHFSIRFLISATNCFLDRTIPYLIVRLKAFWLIFFSILSCLSLICLFQWPKLQIDICHLTFDTIPYQLTSNKYEKSFKSIDIDITYYLGSNWDVPNESFIPLRDYPKLDYILEDQMSTRVDEIQTFAYIFQRNLLEIIEFCQAFEDLMLKRNVLDQHFQHQQISSNQSTKNHLYEDLIIKTFPCFADLSLISSANISLTSSKFASFIHFQTNQTKNCSHLCLNNQTDASRYDCLLCLNANWIYKNKDNDFLLIKNGLRFPMDVQNPRYLFQTITYEWNFETNINNYFEWTNLFEKLKEHFLTKFFSNFSSSTSFWFTSEIFSSLTIFERLQQEKQFLMIIKLILIFIFLMIFTGILGIFVTLTTIMNFLTCLSVLTLFNYKLTIENLSYFVIVLIINVQYSILYSISYKLSPTFFFQRENRTMYSLKQLCMTLIYLTISIILISIPCLFSSLIYFYKLGIIYIVSSLISLIYSTFFLQSLLCFLGPAEHSCLFLPWRLTLTKKFNYHSEQSNDISLRNKTKTPNQRRHHRMSTSSYFASSYFSQIFTGSTYFESEYGGLNDSLTSTTRRRESSRSYQTSHIGKRNSFLTGEVIELYSPRASLAPHLHHHRYSRQSSVSRGLQPGGPFRPLYISPSASPYSQLSIHSQAIGRQQTPSPNAFRPSRSPSPRSFAPITTATTTKALRPCYSAPRIHVPLHRATTLNIKTNETLFEETQIPVVEPTKKSVMIIQRQNAVSSTDELEQTSDVSNPTVSAATRRSMLKATTIESGGLVWLKRSNSS